MKVKAENIKKISKQKTPDIGRLGFTAVSTIVLDRSKKKYSRLTIHFIEISTRRVRERTLIPVGTSSEPTGFRRLFDNISLVVFEVDDNGIRDIRVASDEEKIYVVSKVFTDKYND